mgnify:FL=1
MADDDAEEITVYTTPFCVPCEHLKRFLSERGVPFVVRDLMMDEEAEARVAAAGIHASPALEVDGRIYAGPALEPARLKALLGLE